MNTFWDFPAYVKWDELDEKKHRGLILGALADDYTGVEQIDSHTFILYGPEEALLFKPLSLVYRHSLCLYAAMVGLITSIQRD